MTKNYCVLISLMLLMLVSACGGSQKPVEGVKIGKPYVVSGHTYYPRYQPTYDQVGTASWYGPGFHGGYTANGERYDQDAMTAAHKTLPLPSIVRVTNLSNGKTAIVRVNDRGPFVGDRIIDLSRGAARELGIFKQGTANVRVQYLDAETRQYVSSMPNGADALNKLDLSASQPPATEVASGAFNNAEVAEASNNNISSTPLPAAAPAVAPTPAPVKEDIAEAPPIQPSIWAPVEQPRKQPQRIAARHEPERHAQEAFESVQNANGYFVQAGTFGVKGNADRMLSQLQSMGHAKIVARSGQNKTLYRVLSGPYNSREEAQNMLSRLDTAGISGAKIIRD